MKCDRIRPSCPFFWAHDGSCRKRPDDACPKSKAAAVAVQFVSAVYLTGCAAEPQMRTITVPCRVAIPARPLMPTESLPVDAALDAFVQAAAAEIERREGYEQELRAAIGAGQ